MQRVGSDTTGIHKTITWDGIVVIEKAYFSKAIAIPGSTMNRDFILILAQTFETVAGIGPDREELNMKTISDNFTVGSPQNFLN